MEIEIPDLDDLKFEKSCERCNGTKEVYDFVYDPKTKKDEWGYMPCQYCDKDGYQLTEVGKHLLDFLKKHGFKNGA